MAAANPAKLRQLKDYPVPGIVFRLARLPGTRRLYYGGSDFKIHEIDLSAPKPEPKELGVHGSYVTGLALVGKTLISGSYDTHLSWWDIESGKQVRSIEAHAKWIRDVVAAPDGKQVASVADDMVCRLWDVESGKQLHEFRGHQEKTPSHFPSMLFACAFTPDGKHLATADKVGHIIIWEVASGKASTSLEVPGMYTWDPVQRRHSIGGIRSLAFSPDGRRLAVGGIGKIGNIDHLDGPSRVEVFDWAKGQRIHEFSQGGSKGLVESLRFGPDGSWLLAGGGANAGFLLAFDLNAGNVMRQDKVGMHIRDLALGEGAETLYAGGNGKIAAFEMKG
jgi:WD40 repeat protein